MANKGPQTRRNPFRGNGRSPDLLRYNNDTRYSSRGHQPPVLKRAVSALALLATVTFTAACCWRASSNQHNEDLSEISSSLAYLRKYERNNFEKYVEHPSDSLDTDESDRKRGIHDDEDDYSSQRSLPETTKSMTDAAPVYANASGHNDGQNEYENKDDASSDSDLGTTDSVGGATPFFHTYSDVDGQTDKEPSETSEDPDKSSDLMNNHVFHNLKKLIGDDERGTSVTGDPTNLLLGQDPSSSIQGHIGDLLSDNEENTRVSATNASVPVLPEDSEGSMESSLANAGVVMSEIVLERGAETSAGSTQPGSLNIAENTVPQTTAPVKEAVGSRTFENELVRKVKKQINATTLESPVDAMDRRLDISETLLAEK